MKFPRYKIQCSNFDLQSQEIFKKVHAGKLSFYQFLKNYLTAYMEGRTDFQNLPLPYWAKSINKTKILWSLFLVNTYAQRIKGFQINNVQIGRLHNKAI